MRINLSEHSNFVPTWNKAIDMAAAAIGFTQKYGTKRLAACVFKPTAFMLFVKGVGVMRGQELTYEEEQNLTLEGVKILKGGLAQINFMKLEYVENVVTLPKN